MKFSKVDPELRRFMDLHEAIRRSQERRGELLQIGASDWTINAAASSTFLRTFARSNPGQRGQDGSILHYGDTPPRAQQGVQGDYYLQANGDFFQKRSGIFGVPPSWLLLTNLRGPAGDRGDKGDKGNPGQSGSRGSGTGGGESEPVANRMLRAERFT